MTPEDISIAANWEGEVSAFVAVLSEVRFLDGSEGTYKIHDWAEHNPWAATRPQRIEKARAAASVRWRHKQTPCESHAPSMQSACDSQGTGMPYSPHLSTPHRTTSPPPSANSSFASEENQYGQMDFDERDLRRLADARKETEMKLANGWGAELTEEQIFAYQCARAGVTAKHMREVFARIEEQETESTKELNHG
jgi:hypothetical protein